MVTEEDVYLLAQSDARIDKERSMRRKRLRRYDHVDVLLAPTTAGCTVLARPARPRCHRCVGLANHLDIGDQPRGNPNRNRRTYGHRSCRAQRRDSFAQSSVGQRALSLHNLALGTDRGRIATDGRGVEVGARHLTLRRTTAIARHSSGGRGRAFATPSFEVRSTPGDRAFGQPHRARKPVFSDHAIDRRSAQAGHVRDRPHAKEHRRVVAAATRLAHVRLRHFYESEMASLPLYSRTPANRLLNFCEISAVGFLLVCNSRGDPLRPSSQLIGYAIS
jgi:hypothetical protein